MNDECTCEKCQAGTSNEPDASVWQVTRTDAQTEGRSRTERNFYMVVTDGGISLRQQTFER